MLNKGLILSYLCLLSSNALCQVIDNTASFRITQAKAYIRLHYENDYFSGSDEYYTQGINLEFVSPVLERNPLSRLLLTRKENANQFGMAVEHNAYTPTSFSSNAILYYTLTNNEINRFTVQGNTGIIFTMKAFSLEYFQSILSKEFNSGHSHRWGGIRIGVLF